MGALRKELATLRLGDIRFFCWDGKKLGFSRSLNGEKVNVYVNASDTPWETPDEQVLFGHNADGHTLSPMGFCITKEA